MKTNPRKEGAFLDRDPVAAEIVAEVRREEALPKVGALQNAIFNRASVSNSGGVNFH